MRDQPETLVELCELRATTFPTRPAVDDGVEALNYAGLAAKARAAAAVLRAHGVRPGDRVVVAGRNSTAWVVATFGVLYAGGQVIPLGWGSTAAEQHRVVDRLGPRLVIADADLWSVQDGVTVLPLAVDLTVDLAADQTMDLPATPDHVGAGFAGPGAAETDFVALDLSDFFDVDPDETALLLSTSGTTGVAKFGAMSHRQLARLYSTVSTTVGLTQHDRVLGAVPLAHSFGFNGALLIGLFAGALVRLTPHYDREHLADLVREEQLTVLVGPPTVYHDVAAAGDGRMGTSVRLAITGSTDIAADQIRAACDRLGIPEILVGYGMTETCGTVALGRVPDVVSTPTTLLTPVEGISLRIIDQFGALTAAKTIGRVQVRGFNVLTAYADSTEPIALEDGWLDTGDLGTLDENGLLAVVARTKDTVIVSGFNVFPQDVERVLAEHPMVEQVVVVGTPDPRQGQRLVACVVPRARQELDADTLIAYARERLTPYQVPRSYRMVESLPAARNGKISREAVRQQLADS